MTAFLSTTAFHVLATGVVAGMGFLGTAQAGVESFSASPQVIVAGQSALLSWTATGATSLSLNGQDVTGLASLAVSPTATTTYTLTAVGGSPPGSATVELVVRPAVRINEVMAENTRTLKDEDGEPSDWLELFNAGPVAVDLGGWRLTDDPASLAKWAFPPGTVIPAGGYRLVFASGKNRGNPAASLHTNFRLQKEGEYLALLTPAGLVASQFAPAYPGLAADATYGPGAVPDKSVTTPVGSDAPLKYQIPTGPVVDGWRGGAAFDENGWTAGAFAAGYTTEPQTPVSALSLPANTAGNQAYSGSLGIDFNVLESIDVTDLGGFDDSSNGIATGVTITVQLWARNQNGTPGTTADDSGQSIRASLTFNNAAPGTLKGGYRFKPLATALTLAPGAYTIVAYGYGAAERNGNGVANTVDTGGGLISFVGTSRYGTANQFPGTPDGGPATRYAAGTFGFRRSGPVFRTDLAAMHGQNAGVLVRVPFAIPAGASWQSVSLSIDFDDGFVAWINGLEIARRNAPAILAFDSTATASTRTNESIDVSMALLALRPGAANVLAIHGLNAAANDPDFQLNATLSATGTATALGFLTVPTPGAANSSGMLATNLVINELHYDPIDSKSKLVEFIELYNPTSAAIDLTGWRLASGIDYAFPAGTSVPPLGFLVVAENPSHLQQHLGYATALGPWLGGLNNDGDTVSLQQPALASGFVEVHRVNYELGFPWPTVGDDPGPSIQLLHEGLDPSLGGSWRSGTPTPGAANVVASVVTPPAIRQVSPTPRAPVTGEEVLVTARVTDPDGVHDVMLEYQDVAPGSYIRLTDPAWLTAWTTMAMHDDGLAGDALANDGQFSVILPGSLQQHRHLIRYRIRARDVALASVRVPFADDPVPNFAYFCYDGVPSWTAAVRPGVTPTTTFSASTMAKVRPWHLLSRATDVQNCQYNSGFNDGSFRFEGTLVLGDAVYDHVHYRAKGQNSTFNTGKNKWKFQFNTGHWLQMPDDYGLTATTIKTLNLSSVPAPWAPWNRGLTGLDEAMAFRLANLAGSPAPNSTYVHWRVIDDAAEAPANQFNGDFWGLYLAFENHDNNFKEEHGLEDGNIFRMQVTGAGNSLLGQGKGQPGDLSDLRAFVSGSTGYNKGSPGNLASIQPESWFRANVNLARYFNWRAVSEAVNQTDRRDQENVVYYRSPSTGQWEIYSWDVDLLYEKYDRWGPQGSQNASAYEQIQRALLHPAIRTEFQNRARELQDLLLNADQAWKVVDEYVSLITDEPPRIIPNGDPINAGLVEAERRRWDYWPSNPVPPRGAGALGNYYKTPYPIGNQGSATWVPPTPRVLASADFAGMVKWVKDFIATDSHGGARLALMASGVTNPLTLATGASPVPIPDTPTILYSGPPGYPITQLTFDTSNYSSPNGEAFAAMQWRLGEVRYPGTAGFTPGQPWIYEIGEVWNSGIMTSFAPRAAVPPAPLAAGHTYRARVRHRDAAGHWSRWSAPAEFTTGDPVIGRLATDLVISEIMYHPVEGSAFEWIELRNIHATASLPLDGLRFSAGINWSHTGPHTLAPGGTIVLAADAAAFQQKFGFAPWGTFTGNLDNPGERLVLSLGLNTILRDFAYDDADPWPESADGRGPSLVLIAPDRNPNHANPLNWRASAAPGGTPGGSDAVSFVGDPAADDDHNGWSNWLEHALGPSPALTLDLDDLGRPTVAFTLAAAADDVEILLEASEDLQTWRSGPPFTEPIARGRWRLLTPQTAKPQQFMRLHIRHR